MAGLAENGIVLRNNFSYALIFDLDLGSMGGLVGSLSAFKFSMLIGWLSPDKGGNIAFGVQLPQVDGKLEIKIEGVLTISIEQFNLEYATGADPKMLVLGMHDCYIEVLGTRIPPKGTISIGLFAPTEGADQIGWIGAYYLGEDGGGGGKDPPALAFRGSDRELARQLPVVAEDGGGGSDDVFKLVYLGVGQRVGPPPSEQMSSFSNFLDYMKGPFWDALKAKKYSDIYHPDGKWIIVTDFVLLKVVEVGFVFYDVTPFYALQLKIIGGGTGSGFSFEITYTKISDTIGLFATSISLPDSLRTFQVGVASVTLPTLSVDVYTNGNWKVDLGFPDGDNWSVCFQVQAMAGPVPVTGSGGFYIAYLSSATNPDVFKGTYATIEGFGFAVRLGVGKDFTAGPLKAGVSLTFFGIIQGAAGYLTSNGGNIFQAPDALSLQGQFGIIGELYGSIDFVIIKASVNVRLQASIGIILALEPPNVPGGGNGSILLYIEASVSVSVSVEINLFLFSITISFSFQASFRFEWQLAGSSGTEALAIAGFRAARMLVAPPALGLCPDLPAALPLMYLPELTVVFPDATNPGAPWATLTLGVQYDPAPEKNPKYKDFKPFEAVATQLTTFALMHALNLPSYDAVVYAQFRHSHQYAGSHRHRQRPGSAHRLDRLCGRARPARELRRDARCSDGQGERLRLPDAAVPHHDDQGPHGRRRGRGLLLSIPIEKYRRAELPDRGRHLFQSALRQSDAGSPAGVRTRRRADTAEPADLPRLFQGPHPRRRAPASGHDAEPKNRPAPGLPICSAPWLERRNRLRNRCISNSPARCRAHSAAACGCPTRRVLRCRVARR